MNKEKEIIEYLLKVPDAQLDYRMKLFIQRWSDPATPIQILEVLDLCIHEALASGYVVSELQILYDDSCKANNVSHEDIIKDAIWRNK
jgi:hypothetical protein